jgi:hypothetical protein
MREPSGIGTPMRALASARWGRMQPMGAQRAPRRALPLALPALLAAAVLIAVVIVWALNGGGYESQPALGAGYEPDPWYLGALALIALLCATAAGAGTGRLTRASSIACAALLAYAAWSFASVLWAHDQGAAFLGSDRALVYFAAFATFALLPWTSLSARAALGALVAGVGAVALVAAVKLASTTTPAALYLGARLAWPMGYYNADAVLFMGAATVAVALAARRSTPGALRVAAVTIAALCLQLAVLGQSRGWLFSAPIVLVLMLLLIPGRVRLLLFALLPGAATAAIAPALLRVYGKGEPGGEALPQPALNRVLHAQGHRAAMAMLAAEIALAAVTAALVAVDRRVELSAGAQRRFDRASRIVAIGLTIAGVAVGLVAVHGHAVGRVESAWRSFAHPPAPSGGGYSHFSTLASNRPDIWRVALHEFAANPIGGIGQDNFAAGYVRLRHTYEQPRWTHSVELRLLTHTGAVGALLFALFLAAALVAALRGRRGAARVSAGMLLLPAVVWLVQGSIDWFWEYPALSVPALAFAGAATALDRPTPSAAPRRGTQLRLATVLAGIALGAVMVMAIAIPFLAARHSRAATREWETNPAAAYSQVRAATALLPFDQQLYLLGGSIALNRSEYSPARAWLLQAERHDPDNWLTPFALALVEGEAGRRRAAAAQLERAQARNPLEATIRLALQSLHRGHPLSFEEAQESLAPRIVTPGSSQ